MRNRLLTWLRGPQCPYCLTRTRRISLHVYLDHAYELQNPPS